MGLTTRQWIHLGLDLLGCIPVIGIAANAVNAVLYFQEGDILSGLLSVAGAVIGIGGLSSAIGAAKGICTLAKVGSVLKTAGTAVTTAGMAAMTIEGAVNTYNVLKENDFKITGESLLSAGTTLLSAAATVAGFKALGSSVRETTALIRSGAACFTAGTLVLTENGQKAIEDIQAGDKVYATDPETGESGYKEVLQTFEKETEVVVHVTYEKDNTDSSEEVENSSADEDADIYSNENCADTTDHVVNLQSTETTTVNTTLNHRFWTEAGWKSAGTLEAGDKLTLADGNTATVTNVAYEDTHATVYNFEVEDFHTYYVGTESVLVHNNGGNCMKTASALAQGGSKTEITVGKNFKDHFIRHKNLLENITGKKYPKYKTHGQEFLNDIGKIIDDGTVKYIGKGTLKKGQPVVNIYRGKGVTIVTKANGEFVTILETGKGMDLGIEMIN